MSRLLTLLLLYQNDYIVGKYISLEKLIERTKDSYYDVLQESSKGWMEEENDYEPFVKYILGIITRTSISTLLIQSLPFKTKSRTISAKRIFSVLNANLVLPK